jgi:hypothetical protein
MSQQPHVSEYHDSMDVVCEKGELRQGNTRGRRPKDS